MVGVGGGNSAPLLVLWITTYLRGYTQYLLRIDTIILVLQFLKLLIYLNTSEDNACRPGDGTGLVRHLYQLNPYILDPIYKISTRATFSIDPERHLEVGIEPGGQPADSRGRSVTPSPDKLFQKQSIRAFRLPETRAEHKAFFLHFGVPRPFYKTFAFV